MEKKRLLKAALFIGLFLAAAVGASAQVTISGGFAMSILELEDYESDDGGVSLGANLYADYLLPIGIPLSLGLEIGYDTAMLTDDLDTGDQLSFEGYVIPLLARVAYHFDLMAKLDLYLVGKIGFVFGTAVFDYNGWTTSIETTEEGVDGFGFGIDLGAAFYFTPRIGIFAEAGYDRYNGEKDDFTMGFIRFYTVGISTKF
jgi:hypothetical protein